MKKLIVSLFAVVSMMACGGNNVVAPTEKFEISNIKMLEEYPGTNQRAISFDLNKEASWEVQVYDSTTATGYCTINHGIAVGVTVALDPALKVGHDYILRILAYTKDGETVLEEFSIGTW